MQQGTPIGGTDFITAPPPQGYGMRFYVQDDGSVQGQISIDSGKQGPPGHAHGGSLIALLDEAMGACAWALGHRVVAVHLEFDLKHGVPLDTNVTVRGRVDQRDGRKVFASGDVILPDGRIAVVAEGIFLEAQGYVGKAGDFNPFVPLEA